MRRRVRLWLGVVAVTACVWLAYIPALRAGFIWDDDAFLWNNPHITQSQSPAHFWALWGADRPPDYFPLTSSMLWLEWHWLWGENPAGYHAVNVALHLCGSLMLWAVLSRLGVATGWAWVGAMLFALHPVNVESVAWVTERKNTLPWPLLLAAFWCWLKSEDTRETNARAARGCYAAALALYVLSLLAKTAGVALPVVMLIVLWWRDGCVPRRRATRLIPFFVTAAALGAVTAWYQRMHAISIEVVRDDSMASRIAIAGRAVWFYLWKAVLPRNLSFVYPSWGPADVGDAAAWVPLASLVAAAVLLWSLRRWPWARALAATGFIYVAMLLPVLGLVNIYFMRYTLVADHWQYFAIAAPLGLAAAAVAGISRRGVAIRRVAAIAAAGVLVCLGVMTQRQAEIYRDNETLYRQTLERNPDAWLMRLNLGVLLHGKGDLDEAMTHYREAIRIKPDLADAYLDYGLAIGAQGRLAEAAEFYEKALRYKPLYPEAYLNWGTALGMQARYDEAIGLFQKAIDLYEKGLRMSPEKAPLIVPGMAESYMNWGIALRLQGRLDEAMGLYLEALRIKPDYAEAHNNLGLLLVAQGRLPEAIEHFREAMRLKPDFTPAAENLRRTEALNDH